MGITRQGRREGQITNSGMLKPAVNENVGFPKLAVRLVEGLSVTKTAVYLPN